MFPRLQVRRTLQLGETETALEGEPFWDSENRKLGFWNFSTNSINWFRIPRAGDNESYIPNHEWDGTNLRWQNTDGSWSEWIDLKGSGVDNVTLEDNGDETVDLTFHVGADAYTVTAPVIRGPAGSPPLISMSLDDEGNLIVNTSYDSISAPASAGINEDGDLIITYDTDESTIIANVGRIRPIHRGDFDIDYQYTQMDQVTYSGATYEVKIGDNPPVGTLPNNTTYWVKVTERGPAGADSSINTITTNDNGNGTFDLTFTFTDLEVRTVTTPDLSGPAGPYPVLTVGTVTTLSPEASATFDFVLTSPGNYTVDIGIPKGSTGAAGSGTGDMEIATYDPNLVEGDTFAMDNMVEGTNTKILTAAERADIASNSAARHTHTNSSVLAGTEESFTTDLKNKLDGVAANATANDTDSNLKDLAQSTGIIPNTGLPARLQETSELITDWNSALKSGWYKGGSAAANSPTAGASYVGHVEAYSPIVVVQIAYNISVPTIAVYRRTYNFGSWSAWEQLFSTAGEIVPKDRTITAGTGLTGGGNLSANRTITLSAGSIASLGKADSSVQVGDIGTTVQAYDADTAKTDVSQVFTAPQRISGSTLTSGTTINLALSNGNDYFLTLSHNAVISNPTDIASYIGQKGSIRGQQDGTGGFTLGVSSFWKPGRSSTMPAIPTGPNSMFRIDYDVVSATRIDFFVASVGE